MKQYAINSLSLFWLLTGPISMQGSIVWAMQAFVPPGSNDTPAVETVLPPGVPVPVPVEGGAAGINGGFVQGPPPPGTPGFGGGGTAPIGSDGRMPGLPPGVPLGPPGRSSGPGPGQNPGVPSRGPGGASDGGAPAPSGVVTPGAASGVEPATAKRVRCEVRLGSARAGLPHTGGEFAVAVAVLPLGCVPPVALAAPWIQVLDASKFRFLAGPNTTNLVREAFISIGDASFFVRQEPPVQPGLAVAPGRLVFGLSNKGKANTKKLTAWSERGGGTFTTRAGHPWLTLKPRKSKDGRQSYDVTVQRDSGLGPGRHDTFIELTPAGSTAALRVPVVVEVPGLP